MRKFTLFLMSLFLSVGAMAQVNYTPNHTGAKTRTTRFVSSVSVGNDTYAMPNGTRNSYTDLTSTKTFTVEAGATVTFGIAHSGSEAGWMNAFVYVDMDKNGFTAGIAGDDYTPTGDLVSYSFYNQGYTNDEYGRNSAGTSISGDNRSTLALPSWTVPANLAPGEYRIRFKYDWCNIDPAGATSNYFGNSFTGHGGEIIDAKLVVFNKSELQALIAEAGELLDEVLEPHKAIGDKLNIEGKISSNAGHNPTDGNSYVNNDGQGIAGLTDTDPETYKYLVKTIRNALVKSIDSEYMEKEKDEIDVLDKELKVTKYSYVLDEDAIQDLVKKVAEYLLEEEDFAKKIIL